jgi:hypothetical protein
MLIAACQQGTLNFALGFSCLEMGSARIPKINTNIYSMTSITSNLTELLELMVLRCVYFMVKFKFFIPELWDFIHQIVGDFSYVAL